MKVLFTLLGNSVIKSPAETEMSLLHNPVKKSEAITERSKKHFDLPANLILHPKKTYALEATEHLETPMIKKGDIIIVDRVSVLTEQCIVVCSIDNEYALMSYSTDH